MNLFWIVRYGMIGVGLCRIPIVMNRIAGMMIIIIEYFLGYDCDGSVN